MHWYNPYIFVNFPICILWVLFDIHFSQNGPGWHLWWNPVLSGVVEVYISYGFVVKDKNPGLLASSDMLNSEPALDYS